MEFEGLKHSLFQNDAWVPKKLVEHIAGIMHMRWLKMEAEKKSPTPLEEFAIHKVTDNFAL